MRNVSPQKKRSKLKKKLWQAVSLYVRTRDKGVCITCGRHGEGSGYHCGHFLPSSICGLYLRYDERNLAGQCYNCNINLGGWGERFADALERKHGRAFVDGVRADKNKSIADKDYPWEEKIAYFESKLKQLQTVV